MCYRLHDNTVSKKYHHDWHTVNTIQYRRVTTTQNKIAGRIHNAKTQKMIDRLSLSKSFIIRIHEIKIVRIFETVAVILPSWKSYSPTDLRQFKFAPFARFSDNLLNCFKGGVEKKIIAYIQTTTHYYYESTFHYRCIHIMKLLQINVGCWNPTAY